MQSIIKNRNGVASPLEFSLAMVVFIISFVIVTVSMSSSVYQSTLTQYFDADAKAVEITRMLLSNNPDIGLVTDYNSPMQLPESTPSIDTTIEVNPDLIFMPGSISNDPLHPKDSVTIFYKIKNQGGTVADGDIIVTANILLGDEILESSTFDPDTIHLSSGSVTDVISKDMLLDGLEPCTDYVLNLTIDPVSVEENNILNNFGEIPFSLFCDINNPPFPPELVFPQDNEPDVDINAKLSVYVRDPNYDSMTVSFYNALGPTLIETVPGVASDTDVVIPWTELSYLTTYSWYAVADDGISEPPTQSDTFHFTTKANPAETPETIYCQWVDYPPNLLVGQLGEFTVVGFDEDSPELWFTFDWGNGIIVQKEGPYPTGTDVTKKHSWPQEGIYTVQVVVCDEDEHCSQPISANVQVIGGAVPKCFLDGTQVMMANGLWKNIEYIKPGDLVKSYDILSRSYKTDKVREVFTYSAEEMGHEYYLKINDKLKVTPDHPFYINGEWIQAKNLGLINYILNVDLFSIEKIYEKQPNYNLHTERYHNYIVNLGNTYLIAHNAVHTYIIGGYDEDVYLGGYKSGNTQNPIHVLYTDKIERLSEMDYNDLRNTVFDLPVQYNFVIKIYNQDSIFLDKDESGISSESASTIASNKEIVVITDGVNYASATLEVTVFS